MVGARPRADRGRRRGGDRGRGRGRGGDRGRGRGRGGARGRGRGRAAFQQIEEATKIVSIHAHMR